jgi:hypothetical protein
MTDELFARWRRVHLSHRLVDEDFLDCLRRLEAWYPDTVYFEVGAMRDLHDVYEMWRTLGPIETFAKIRSADDAPPLYRSWQDCLTATPVVKSGGESYRRFLARVPWPEEMAAGQPSALAGSRALPYEFQGERDFATWRALGRLVEFDWNMDFPIFISACAKQPWPSYLSHFDPEKIAHCSVIPSASGITEFDIKYCHNDLEMRAFANAIRRLTNGLLTHGYGIYDAMTGRHVGDFVSPSTWHLSKRVAKLLAIKPHCYSSVRSLHKLIKDFHLSQFQRLLDEPDRLVGTGPTLRMKSEAFLEAGRSIDEIDGLDPETRDAELRRYERRLKADEKSAGRVAKPR